MNKGQLRRQQFENQIELLGEQINTQKMSDEHLRSRIASVEQQIASHNAQEQETKEKLETLRTELFQMKEKEREASERTKAVSLKIAELDSAIESRKSSIISLLNQRATVKARIQRYDTMLEQAQIRKAQLSKEALQLKSESAEHEAVYQEISGEYQQITERIDALNKESESANEDLSAAQQKLYEYNRQMEQEQAEYHREFSRLESLKNIAERYDGYGNSIRRVMEQKAKEKGILGVVADIIKVEKAYEVAVETALGGSIQNIVTDTEETAKRQIDYLKRNKYGRATFLPLSAISGRGAFLLRRRFMNQELSGWRVRSFPLMKNTGS